MEIVPLGDSALILRAPGRSEIRIPFDTRGASCAAVVWGDIVSAIDQGETAAQWLSEFIGIGARLVRFDQRARR